MSPPENKVELVFIHVIPSNEYFMEGVPSAKMTHLSPVQKTPLGTPEKAVYDIEDQTIPSLE
jgi:hypothetical protein